MEPRAREAIEEFRRAVDALVQEHWSAVAPGEGHGLDPVVVAEMGSTYCSGWVLVVGSAAFEEDPEKSNHAHTRFTAPGLLPWTGIGLLADSLAAWTE